MAKNNPWAIEKIQDQQWLTEMMTSMQNIAQISWVKFVIDTSKPWIAWMIPWRSEVYFNPLYAKKTIEKSNKERWVDFQLEPWHLAAIILHEIWHIINKDESKKSNKKHNTEQWNKTPDEYYEYLVKKYGEEFHRFNNILEDIDVNNYATQKKAPVYEKSKQEIYENMVCPNPDLTSMSLQDQFAWACLREAMLPWSRCEVDPLVRRCVNTVASQWWILNKIKNPHITYDEQLEAIAWLYENYYLKLKQKQKEEEEEEQDDETDQEQSPWEWNQEWDEWQWESDEQNNDGQWKSKQKKQWWSGTSQDDKSDDDWNNNESSDWSEWGDEWDQSNGKWKGGEDKDDKWNEWDSPNDNNDEENNPWKTSNPRKPSRSWKPSNSQSGSNSAPEKWNDQWKNIPPSLMPHIFDDLWDPNKTADELKDELKDALSGDNKSNEKNPMSEQVKDAISKMAQEHQAKIDAEKNKSELEKKVEQELKSILWLDPEWDPEKRKEMKKQLMHRYEKIEPFIKQLRDKNWRLVYQTIIDDIFKKIISIRKKKQIQDTWPVPFDQGSHFDTSTMIWGILSWMAWDPNPRIMRRDTRIEKTRKNVGKFNFTLIADGSWSMEWQKNKDQKINTLLVLYALNQLNQQIKDQRHLLKEWFEIQTAGLMFAGSRTVKTFKERSENLSLQDILKANHVLDYCDWDDTNGYDALKKYYDEISKPLHWQNSQDHEKRLADIKSWKIKEIVCVMSDGWFNHSQIQPAKEMIEKLRSMWIIVLWIGITSAWSPILDIFWKQTNDPEKDKYWRWIVCEDPSELWQDLTSLLIHHLEQKGVIN